MRSRDICASGFYPRQAHSGASASAGRIEEAGARRHLVSVTLASRELDEQEFTWWAALRRAVLRFHRVSEKFAKAVEYAVGDAVLCDSLDEARQLAYHSRGNERYKVVTLDGALINKAGLMTGGSSNGDHFCNHLNSHVPRPCARFRLFTLVASSPFQLIAREPINGTKRSTLC